MVPGASRSGQGGSCVRCPEPRSHSSWGWVYRFPVRRAFIGWGATAEDLALVMPGDTVILDPTDVATQVVTVEARPEDIWPRLVQMGHRRGGLYSYDWLDLLFGFLDRPSADRILPESSASPLATRYGSGRTWR